MQILEGLVDALLYKFAIVVTCKSFYGYSILPFIQLSMYLFAIVYLLNAELSYWAVIWELMFVDEEKQDNQGTSLIIISKKKKKIFPRKSEFPDNQNIWELWKTYTQILCHFKYKSQCQ